MLDILCHGQIPGIPEETLTRENELTNKKVGFHIAPRLPALSALAYTVLINRKGSKLPTDLRRTVKGEDVFSGQFFFSCSCFHLRSKWVHYQT